MIFSENKIQNSMKILAFFTTLSIFISSLQADQAEIQSKPCSEKSYADFYFLEIRAAYLYPSSNHFRTYYSGGLSWGAELDCRFAKYFYTWISAEYFSKDGKTSTDSSTNLILVPINAGIKWLYSNSFVQPYLGLGLETSYLREKIDSPLLLHSLSFWNFGLRFKTGFLIRIFEYFYTNIYLDYSLKCANLHKPTHSSVIVLNPNTSHFSFGGGFGYAF